VVRRLADRLVSGLLVALILLGGMQLLADRIQPVNRGMTTAPCPPRESHTATIARMAFLTLAGRPNEVRDWAELCFYQQDNALLARSGRRPEVVFLGDSITQYWGSANPGFFDGRILNRGIAGQTSPQVLVRLVPDALALQPDVIHVLVGLNDIVGARGPIRFADYQNNINAMVTLARARGVQVIIGAVPPANAGEWPGGPPAERIRQVNAWLAASAGRSGDIFADYWSAMVAPDGTMRPELADDGIHPNAAGYAVMEPIARAALAAARARLDKPREALPVS